MTKPAPKPAPPPKPPRPDLAYLVFGSDEHAKPRAAVFTGIDVKLLEKAAEGVNLRVVPVVGDDLIELARKMPVGKLHASGRGFVPYVRGDLFSELVMVTCGDHQPPDKGSTSLRRPAVWDDIRPGDLVVTQESHECGWWEAIVVERKGDGVTLKYRDYPKLPVFLRHRSVVALLGALVQQAA